MYRFRYIIGYAVIIILLVGLLFLQLRSVPMGFSPGELASAVKSFGLPLDARVNPVDLPYHILQKISIYILGPTALGIKLPSLLIGFATGISIFVLLSRWFKKNVAVIVTILAITASQFLITSRSGSPEIMLLFWPIVTLTLATLVSQEVRLSGLYKFLLGIAVVLSLYTPFMIYLLLSAFLAALIHPHLRYIIKRYGFAHVSITTVICGILLLPLAYNLYLEPSLILTLAGLPAELPTLGQYAQNFLSVITSIAGFTQRQVGIILVPAFSAGLGILMLFGLIKTFQHYYSARSHLLLVWIALLVPVIATNPTALPMLYAPLILLAAIGVEALIREWYGLFPSNPYARVAALLPLAILIASLVTFDYARYFNSYAYAPAVAAQFSADLPLLQSNITKTTRPNIVVSDPSEIEAMKLVRVRKPGTSVIGPEQLSAQAIASSNRVYISQKAIPQLTTAQLAALGKPASVLVSDRQADALRFLIFQR